MGGERSLDWDLHPERDAILVGTQDMLLSRALNRGYGMSRFRWPLHYGLLNPDCLWVFDEVQLMSAGLAASTQLQAFRDGDGRDWDGTVGPSKSLWMSATLRRKRLASADFRDRIGGLRTIPLTEADDEAEGLKPRWNAEKPLEAAGIAAGDATSVAAFVAGKHQARTRTLVIVNTADRARNLFQALRKRKVAAEIKLIHSRFRPHERASWAKWLRNAPSSLPPGARGIVATQVVEAGVDLSARTLVTELALWPSLVQRFVRCNRRGEFGGSEPAAVCWIDLETNRDTNAKHKDQTKLALPCFDAELKAAREHLRSRTDVGPRSLEEFVGGLTGRQQAELFPFAPTHVVRRKDLVELFDTTPDLEGNDGDVSRFLGDGDDLDVQVFWRPTAPDGNWSKAELRRQAPRRDELCPVSVAGFNAFLKSGNKRETPGKSGLKTAGKTACRFDPPKGRSRGSAKADAVFPGQVYWVPADQGGYDRETGWSPDTVPLDPSLLGPFDESETAAADAETGFDDELSERKWQTVAEHTGAVVRQLDAILAELPADALPEPLRRVLRTAARWHDWDKRREVFQNAIIDRPAERQALDLAKAPRRRWTRCHRIRFRTQQAGSRRIRDKPKDLKVPAKHFRHELASALGMLGLVDGTDPPAD